MGWWSSLLAQSGSTLLIEGARRLLVGALLRRSPRRSLALRAGLLGSLHGWRRHGQALCSSSCSTGKEE